MNTATIDNTNNKQQTVAVIGAGALGLMYMESIFPIMGEDSYFLADGKRFETQRGKSYKDAFISLFLGEWQTCN